MPARPRTAGQLPQTRASRSFFLSPAVAVVGRPFTPIDPFEVSARSSCWAAVDSEASLSELDSEDTGFALPVLLHESVGEAGALAARGDDEELAARALRAALCLGQSFFWHSLQQ